MLESIGTESPTVTENEGRQCPLFLPREARKVGMGQDIGAVFVVAGVAHEESNLVDFRSPLEQLAEFGILDFPIFSDLIIEVQGGLSNTTGVLGIHLKSLHQTAYGSTADIAALGSADHVDEDSFPQGRGTGDHVLDLERVDDSSEHRQAAR